MKRVVSAFLLVVVILGLLPIQASAIDTEIIRDDTFESGFVVREYITPCSFGQYKDPGFGINSDHTIAVNGSMINGYWSATYSYNKDAGSQSLSVSLSC